MQSGRGSFDKAGNRAWSWATFFHVVAHLAMRTPFLTAAAESTRGNWRVIGDGAAIAMRSWHVMTQLPLVGQPTELGTGLHDLGPLQYWMLAVPRPHRPDDQPGTWTAVLVGVAPQLRPAGDVVDLVEGHTADRRQRRVPRFSTHTTRHLCLTDLARMGWELRGSSGSCRQY